MSWKREPLDEEELQQLIEAAESDSMSNEFIIRVLAHTGLRVGEFCAMRSSWVDWQAELLRVPAEEGDWSPKSSAGARSIPLKDPDTIRVMREFFKRNDSIPWTRSTVYRRVVSVAAQTDVKRKVTPHVLRHTYGSLIASRGATAQYIRQTMGHATIESSQNYLQYHGATLQSEADELW